MLLSFTYHHEESPRQNLRLSVGDHDWCGSAYYLGLDVVLQPGREDEAKVRAVLLRLHQQWLSALERLSPAQPAFLPYDFSDEYTGWLRCEWLTGDEVLVTDGTSELGGWTFPPSAIPGRLVNVPDFKPKRPASRFKRHDFERAIRDSMHAIEQTANA